jgi:hypothetical protein
MGIDHERGVLAIAKSIGKHGCGSALTITKKAINDLRLLSSVK